MRFTQITRSLALALASIGLVVPQAGNALAAGPETAVRASGVHEARKLADVALTTEGKLQGQVIDRQGVARANSKITITTSRGEIVENVSADSKGYFAAKVAKSGVYTIATSETSTAIRVWTRNSAPPAAHEGLMIVDERGTAVRGQDGDDGDSRRRLLWIGAGGVILTGVIIAAVEQGSGS